MHKAIFLDYTGTMVREDEPYTMELLQIFLANSDLKSPDKALSVVWGLIKKIEYDCYLDSFIKKDEMVDRILDYCVKNYGLNYDLEKMHVIWRNSWIHAPLFDDVKPFLERVTEPVFVITNDDTAYIEESLREKEVTVSGIVSAEMVRACKPHREILDEALRMSGVKPEEAVMIGDSVTSDVECARTCGVTPVLLDRKGRIERSDIRVIRSLADF